jgi:hypothetical protein
MALNNFSTELFVVTVNGRQITDWGDANPPYQSAEIDPDGVLRRGQGGNACRLDRQNPGRRVTLNLNPGSPDSAYLQGLRASKANITLSSQQIGTLETEAGSEGMFVSKGPKGRAGTTITDDVYVIEFNSWTELAGGA